MQALKRALVFASLFFEAERNLETPDRANFDYDIMQKRN